MKHTTTARDRTRRAILEATADVIADTSAVGFSVQAVADRAGVSHRTVYNHFPTREALCEGFSAYVDELLLADWGREPEMSMDTLPGFAESMYTSLAQRDRYVRAYVMLMIGNRSAVRTWRTRTRAFERMIARAAGPHPPLPPRLMAAAVRMFLSSMGWHLLTEQCGLSTDEAARAGGWAARTLLAAATAGSTTAPPRSRRPSGGSHAPRRRRT